MKKLLSLFLVFVLSNILVAQNDPIAVNDTVTTMSEQTIAISVLLNDYDPDGDDIEIRNVRTPEHGERDNNDSIIFYTPDLYVGMDSLEYRIMEVDNNSNKSEYAWVFIDVTENPNIPIAIDDEAEVLQLVPTEINILDNDSDPNGDDFIIDEVKLIGISNFELDIAEDSLSVIFTTNYPLDNSPATFEYRIKEKNTVNSYYSNWATATINIIDNHDIPTVEDDVTSTMAGETIEIYVMENDINPSSSQLELGWVEQSTLGSVEIINDHLKYTPDYSISGTDTISYKIQLVDQTYLYDYGFVIINIAKNPGCPIAVNDDGTGICGGETIIEVLENDYDPEGSEVEIKDVRILYPFLDSAQIQGPEIVVSSLIDGRVVNSEFVRLEYRIQEVDNPESFSEWATITIEMEQDHNYPTFYTDYGSSISGYPVEIDIFANDNLNGTSADVVIYSDYGNGIYQLNETLTFTSFMSTFGLIDLVYWKYGDDYFVFGEIELEIDPIKSYDTLDINNISAGINSDGFLFSRLKEVIGYDPFDIQSHFEYPKGSDKHTIFSSSLWIGGTDQHDSLHLAAQRYKQIGYDYQFGPISSSYEGIDFFIKWSRVWKVSKEEVQYHRNNYWKDTYEPIDAIINWPGNGDVSNGQSEQLAPYFDKNENGVYEPMSGDYPLIRGDQSIFFIFNDDMIHTETAGKKMDVEVHGMAYAFNAPEDEMLNNTIFVHYDIYNRSENTYYNTYLGTFADIDLGYSRDDYVGCNVGLGSFYGYNGRLIDGWGEPEAYGANPPTQSVTIIAGPTMDGDNSDNPSGGCDYSINGLNFGDGIIDNERYGMTRFVFFNNGGNPAQSDPNVAPEYYNYLRGYWNDNTSIMYGGTGHISYPGTVGPDCSFMFPGDSDPDNWGTDCEFPHGGYNQNEKYWTEETGDNGNPNPPADRRGLGVSGPFTFEPGERQELELAFSVGQGEDGPVSSTQQLFDNLSNLFQMVDEGQIIIPSDQLSVEYKESNNINLKLYPNPVKEVVYIEVKGEVNEILEYYIYNNLGNIVSSGQIFANIQNSIRTHNIDQGLYIIKVKNQETVCSDRFVKM